MQMKIVFPNLFVKLVRHRFTGDRKNFSKATILSTNVLSTKPVQHVKGLEEFAKEENVEFMENFPAIVNELTSNQNYSDIPDFTKKIDRLLHYTVPTGKKVRGLTTVITYKMLEKPDNLTPENIKLANILGWCSELLGSSILIVDDILDASEMRRNAPCWYRNEDVGKLAILDAIILENSIHGLLKKYFYSHPFYVPMVELITNTSLSTAIGQNLDSVRLSLEQITMERFVTITKYKTCYYTFWFPVTLGMYFSKAFNEKLQHQSTPILMEMGHYFQIKNDYFDCFGDSAITGKDGTDIQEGKCTWMSVRALQKANSSQRKLMEEHFGNSHEKSVKVILSLYEELNLHEEFAMYERQSFERISAQIDEITHAPLLHLLHTLVEKLYKRTHCFDM